MNDSQHLYPDEIILEVTNCCNLNCRFCHFHGDTAEIKRRLGYMAPEIWKKLLNDIRQWHRPCTLLTHGAGEPLLYPHLEALLRRAKEIPQLHIGFMTNGMLLTPDVARMLVALEVDSIAFSIDGVNPETHDYFRRNANLKQIEMNVQFLIEEKEKRGVTLPRLSFNMVGYPEILEQETAYVEKWLPHAESVMISTFRPVGSRKLWDDGQESSGLLGDSYGFIPSFTPCALLYHQTVISIDGNVGLCCEDIHLDVPMGNIMNKDVAEIYQSSPHLSHYRQAHEKKEISSLKLCRDCHVWGGHLIVEKKQMELGEMRVLYQMSPSGKVYQKI